mmetsp:Transcript_103656/g.293470  ORF Transcript_103656/g.293470 Transcript_103656/m.293470 type:complete len:221 (-) Transcript_103656:266-928(-)
MRRPGLCCSEMSLLDHLKKSPPCSTRSLAQSALFDRTHWISGAKSKLFGELGSARLSRRSFSLSKYPACAGPARMLFSWPVRFQKGRFMVIPTLAWTSARALMSSFMHSKPSSPLSMSAAIESAVHFSALSAFTEALCIMRACTTSTLPHDAASIKGVRPVVGSAKFTSTSSTILKVPSQAFCKVPYGLKPASWSKVLFISHAFTKPGSSRPQAQCHQVL